MTLGLASCPKLVDTLYIIHWLHRMYCQASETSTEMSVNTRNSIIYIYVVNAESEMSMKWEQKPDTNWPENVEYITIHM